MNDSGKQSDNVKWP